MKPYYESNGITIYHGDARELLTNFAGADAIVTDPPYKLSQEYGPFVDNDNLNAMTSIVYTAPLMLAACKPGAVAVVFYDNRLLPFGINALQRGGWKYLRTLTLYRRWGAAHKLSGWMSTSDFALVVQRPGTKPKFYGPWAHDVFTKSSPEAQSFDHPAQKPLSFVEQIVANVGGPSSFVLDPYMGSGTTLVAAKRLNLACVGIELEERYCEIAARRLDQEVLAL